MVLSIERQDSAKLGCIRHVSNCKSPNYCNSVTFICLNSLKLYILGSVVICNYAIEVSMGMSSPRI